MAQSRFWGGDSSSSASDSDDDDDEQPQVPTTATAPRGGMRARWAEESSSDESAGAKRKVVSHTDKRLDQLVEQIKVMKNHMKIDDFAKLITDYDAMLKMLDKLKGVIERDGGPPNYFIKALTNLEVYCDRLHQELQEKKASTGERLSENRQKAFNTLRARVRKQNKSFQEQIDHCKEHPSDFESAAASADEKSDSSSSSSEPDSDASSNSSGSDSSSDSSSSSSSSDSDSDSGSDSSGDSLDSDASSNSDSDSDSSDSDKSDSFANSGTSGSDDEDGDKEAAREKKMLRWLITPEQEMKIKKKEEARLLKEKGEQAKKDSKKKDQSKKDADKSSAKRDETAKSRISDDREEYSPEELMKKVTDIAQQRGRRNFDRATYAEKLQGLMAHAAKQGPRAQLLVWSSSVSADFDNTGTVYSAMRIDLWNEALIKVSQMLPLLIDSWQEMKDNDEEMKTITPLSPEEGVDESSEDPRSHWRQQELFVAFFEKLDDELYKALQFTVDVYGAEYQEILANSSKFLVLLKRVVKFFEDTKQPQCLGVVALRLMEQLYYKPDMLNEAVYKAIVSSGAIPDEEKADWEWPDNSQEFMASLCRYVYATGQARLQRRALLCKAYHLALHNEFQAARDLLHLGNMSFDTLSTQEADVHTQILYNRVLAQMGLSAFRLGRIVDAHNSLGDVCMHNKARELLAQGISFAKNMERTAEQERAERLRQLPYHMHINLEVLESAHHICAMLLEVPNLAMQTIDPNNKRQISRVLRRALESYDKMLFIGPPENAKEAVVCAAKALQKGDWTSACSALEELKIWDHIDTCNPLNGKNVKEMIKEKIKTEALRTYLFSYASIYDAFHLEQLADMFDLPPKMVHSLVSKMMIKEEITAFWDESSKFVLMQHVEPTPLQRLALTLADRGAQAVANNESLVDQKAGGYGFKDQRPAQQGRWEQDGGKGSRRFGKGGGMDDLKGRKGKGKGKSGMAMSGPPKNRGWENARAGALRGSAQRGWGTAIRN